LAWWSALPVWCALLASSGCGGKSILERDRSSKPADAGTDNQGDASGGNEPTDAASDPPADAADPPDAPMGPPADASDPPDADAPLLEVPVLAAAGSTDYGWTCGLSVHGRVTCWGGTHFIPEFAGEYQLPGQARYLDIWITPTQGCGIEAETRRIQCWGYEPIVVPPAGAFRKFARGGQFGAGFCALRDDGAAVCFSPSRETVRLGPFQDYARGNLECGVDLNGSLRCWRAPATELLSIPFPPERWTEVAVGQYEFCALSTTGVAHCGDLSTATTEPPDVHPDVRQLSLGFTGTCAVKLDGALECWTTSALPADIPPAGSFDAVAVGFHLGCAARTDGTVACWGRNDYGQASPPTGLSLR